eukprot:7632382-Prorocentrum_lima.AAC.1
MIANAWQLLAGQSGREECSDGFPSMRDPHRACTCNPRLTDAGLAVMLRRLEGSRVCLNKGMRAGSGVAWTWLQSK